MQRGSFVIALVALFCALPARSSAQCADGRVVGEETAGRCCWPGQRWNDGPARCEGPPSSCPAGWGAEGDACVPTASAAALARPSEVLPPNDGQSNGDQPNGGQSSAPDFRWRSAAGTPSLAPSYAPGPPSGGTWERPAASNAGTEPIMGVMQVGIMLLSVGYGASMGVAIALSTQSYTYTSNGYGFVPVVGGIMWAVVDSTTSHFGAGWGDVFGVPASIVQVAGLVMLLAGGIARRPRAGGRGYADATPRLVGGPGQVGLGLAWDL